MNNILLKTKICSLSKKLTISKAIIIAFSLTIIHFYKLAIKFWFSTKYDNVWTGQFLFTIGFMIILVFFYQLTLNHKFNQLIKEKKHEEVI